MAERRTWTGSIRPADDARRLLDQVNTASVDKQNTTALAHAVQHADEVELRPDASRLLNVDPQLKPLLPWPGLPRGATINVVGSTSLLLALIAGAMRDGGWAAIVGLPHLGVLAAIQEHRLAAERLALVPNPGPDWPQVVSALVDGVDVVAVAVPGPVADSTVRTLQARAREKGCVLVPTSRWPGASTTLKVTGRRREGLGHGSGRLKRQTLDVTASGRGAAARLRKATVAFGEPVVDAATLITSFAPPAHNYASPEPAAEKTQNGTQTDLSSTLKQAETPADPWAQLMRHLPRIDRSRPWH